VLGSQAGFNTIGPVNQWAVESAPVLEELFGSMVKLTKDNKKPGSIVGEILDTHERGEIPESTRLPGNFAALRNPGQSASRTRNRSQAARHTPAQVTDVARAPPR
jgi:hypothetical protein